MLQFPATLFPDRESITAPRLWFKFFKPLNDEIAKYNNDLGLQALTLTGGWAQYSNPAYAPVGFRIVDDVVYLQGYAAGGTTGSPGIATLPPGARPAAEITAVVPANTGYARVDVNSSGVIWVATYVAGGSNAAVSLNGIRFYGAN